MADLLVDWSHTNDGDGDGWADQVGAGGAINNLVTAGTTATAGQLVAVRGVKTGAGAETWVFQQTDAANPVVVVGVLVATTNTTIVAGDIVPGLRNGSSTRAYAQTAGNAPPSWTQSSGDAEATGFANFYGLRVAVNTVWGNTSGVLGLNFEECSFEISIRNSAADYFNLGSLNNNPHEAQYKNCEIDLSNNIGVSIKMLGRGGLTEFIGTQFLGNTTVLVEGTAQVGRLHFYGCDYSAVTGGNLVDLTSIGGQTEIIFANCKENATPPGLTTDTSTGTYRVERRNCSGVTSKSSGSVQDYEVNTEAGDIVEETTVVRTGGADDGAAGGFSYAMTPTTGDTVRNNHALISPWLTVWVANTDTSLTIYFANSLAESSPTNDLHDDQVWIEVLNPSEGGTAQHTFHTSQMDLLATPADLTSDGSTWGSGGNNAQKIVTTISPDYEGVLYARLHYAPASTTTLYLDPFPEVA